MKSLFSSSKAVIAMAIAASVGLPVVLHMSFTRFRESRERSQAFEYFTKKNRANAAGASIETSLLEPENDQQQEWWNNMVGYWQGGINNNELRLIYRFASEFGRLFTYSIDQGGDLLAATATRFNPDTEEFRLYFETIHGVYKAKLTTDGQHLQGTWTQYGRPMKLDMDRFVPNGETEPIPRGLAFALDKRVTATNVPDLMKLEGYWSGDLPDKENPDEDDDQNERFVFVVLQIEGLTTNAVEPSIIMPEDSPFPLAVRNFVVQDEGKMKLVLDPPIDATNAIFYATVKSDDDGKLQMVGQVHYDDTDYAPPLTLVWSKDYPKQQALISAIKKT